MRGDNTFYLILMLGTVFPPKGDTVKTLLYWVHVLFWKGGCRLTIQKFCLNEGDEAHACRLHGQEWSRRDAHRAPFDNAGS